MYPRGILVLFLGLFAGWPAPVRAGQPLSYYLPADATYNAAVPTPEAFFGFAPGEWHLRSDQLLAYCEAVAKAAPDRVKYEVIGRTWEQRPLALLTITSADNHRNLEKIRTDHLALFDPAKAAGLDLAAMPLVVDLGYSIHGNEPSGANAVPLVLYHLAAAQGPASDALLQHTVILLEPQRNPDGGDRFATWVNAHKGAQPSADPATREHNEAWPRGRGNHYWFDLNRDWLPLVHPESRARIELFHRWRPNVLTDHHEMQTSGTFFFQPGVPTRNNPSTPPRVVELTAKIAAYHAKALDARGGLYFTEQMFDDFYPGKGSTYPDLHGCVGILFEQGSSRGHLQESENGPLSFAFTIRNQVTSTLSTLEAAQALRGELRAVQKEFVPQTLELARKGRVKAYVFGNANDPARAAAFLGVLARHQIEVRPLTEEVTNGGFAFRPGAAWVVPTEQPQFRLLTEVFTRRTEFADPIFYDVSTWTLPLGFGLPCAELERVPAAGEPVGAATRPTGRLVGGHSDYAYLLRWAGAHAPRALARLHRAGILVKGAGAPFEAATAEGPVAFGYGTLLVPVGLQPQRAKDIAALIDTIVQEDSLLVYGVTTGLTPKGVDLGSASFNVLKPVRVALLVGEGVDSLEAGDAWHGLDVRAGLPVTLLELAQAGRVDLSRYNVLVLADGNYDAVADPTVAALKRWVREGGVLIAQGRGAAWAATKELARAEVIPAPGTASAREAAEGTPRAGAGESGPPFALRKPYASASDELAKTLVRGAIFATTVDGTHPVGYGLGSEQYAAFRDNRVFLRPARSPYETPVVYTDKPLLSGYVSPENLRALAGSAAVIAQPSGAGAVVLFPDNPNFRGYWLAGNRLFLNAVFYGQTIKAPSARGEGATEQ
jgi:hypothetical protein